MTDLKTLREVAEAATPGPWRVRTNRHKTTSGEEWGWVSNMTTQNISLPGMSINWEAPAGHANATHIAVFNPVLVLSLLDRIEELEGALAKIGSGSFPDAVNLALGGGWHTFVDRLQEIARAALHPEPLGEGGGL